MLAIAFEQPIKLQSGLLYPRVEAELKTHSGDEIYNSVGRGVAFCLSKKITLDNISFNGEHVEIH